jgi:hypothetical protein
MQSRNGVSEPPRPLHTESQLPTQRLTPRIAGFIILLFLCFVQGAGSFCLRTTAPCMGILFRTRRFSCLAGECKAFRPDRKLGNCPSFFFRVGRGASAFRPPAGRESFRFVRPMRIVVFGEAGREHRLPAKTSPRPAFAPRGLLFVQPSRPYVSTTVSPLTVQRHS